MATESDIEIVQGETKVFSATWTISGVPRSIDGYAAHMQVRARPGSFTKPPLLELSSEGTSPELTIEPGGATGEVKVRIPGGMTETLRRGTWYSLFVINKADPTERVRLAFGKCTISLSSTSNEQFVLDMAPDVVP